MSVTAYKHRAQYYETDQMGIIHHSNHIRWFEEARVDFMDRLGYGYTEMEAEGIMSPLLSAHCEYKSMIRFGDEVYILPTIQTFTGAKMFITYRILDVKTGELRAIGETRHCFLKDGRTVSLKKASPTAYALFMDWLGKEIPIGIE